MCADKLQKVLQPGVEKHIKRVAARMKLFSGVKRHSKYEDFWFIL